MKLLSMRRTQLGFVFLAFFFFNFASSLATAGTRMSWAQMILGFFCSPITKSEGFSAPFEALEESDWQTAEEQNQTDQKFIRYFSNALNGQHFVISDSKMSVDGKLRAPDMVGEDSFPSFGADFLKQKKKAIRIGISSYEGSYESSYKGNHERAHEESQEDLQEGGQDAGHEAQKESEQEGGIEMQIPLQVFSDYLRNRKIEVVDEWGEPSRKLYAPSLNNVEKVASLIWRRLSSICQPADDVTLWPALLLFRTTQGFDAPLQRWVALTLYAAMDAARPYSSVYSKDMLEEPLSPWRFTTEGILTRFRFTPIGMEIVTEVSQTLKKYTETKMNFTMKRRYYQKYSKFCTQSRNPRFLEDLKPFEEASFKSTLPMDSAPGSF